MCLFTPFFNQMEEITNAFGRLNLTGCHRSCTATHILQLTVSHFHTKSGSTYSVLNFITNMRKGIRYLEDARTNCQQLTQPCAPN